MHTLSSITLSAAAAPLHGEITVPGDKSISHRSVMFGALADGDTRIRGFLRGADCLSTISCFRQLGISIDESEDEIIVHGKGLEGLTAPSDTLDAGNSGTTVRLMSGILCGQPFPSAITGDASIQKRPMKRVIEPLTQMGGDIISRQGNGCAPLLINSRGRHSSSCNFSQDFSSVSHAVQASDIYNHFSELKGITYRSPVASAQVKSAVLLAGLYADGDTTVIEPALSRDHTERMLRGFGADVKSYYAKEDGGYAACIRPRAHLTGMDLTVPGDISSAAYFIAAALLVPGSEILIRNVGINPTRDGILHVAKAMGGDITRMNERQVSGEPVADLLVRASELKGTNVSGALIPTLIDELPVVAVMAACASGTTVIADAAELKVKESDRIAVVCEALHAMGVHVTPTDDGMIIEGGHPLHGARIDSHDDHRIAMSFAVAALICDGDTIIEKAACIAISYPGFFDQLEQLSKHAAPGSIL